MRLRLPRGCHLLPAGLINVPGRWGGWGQSWRSQGSQGGGTESVRQQATSSGQRTADSGQRTTSGQRGTNNGQVTANSNAWHLQLPVPFRCHVLGRQSARRSTENRCENDAKLPQTVVTSSLQGATGSCLFVRLAACPGLDILRSRLLKFIRITPQTGPKTGKDTATRNGLGHGHGAPDGDGDKKLKKSFFCVEQIKLIAFHYPYWGKGPILFEFRIQI